MHFLCRQQPTTLLRGGPQWKTCFPLLSLSLCGLGPGEAGAFVARTLDHLVCYSCPPVKIWSKSYVLFQSCVHLSGHVRSVCVIGFCSICLCIHRSVSFSNPLAFLAPLARRARSRLQLAGAYSMLSTMCIQTSLTNTTPSTTNLSRHNPHPWLCLGSSLVVDRGLVVAVPFWFRDEVARGHLHP